MQSKTNPVNGPNPTINEQFTMTVEDEALDLYVTVEQPMQKRLVLTRTITFDEICGKNDSNRYPKDWTCYNDDQGLKDLGITVDITLTYTPNKPQQLNNRLQRDEFELRESATLLD